MDDIVPGSMWQTNRERGFYVDIDGIRSVLHEVPAGSIVLVLARHRARRREFRFWLLINGRLYRDVVPNEFLEPVTP